MNGSDGTSYIARYGIIKQPIYFSVCSGPLCLRKSLIFFLNKFIHTPRDLDKDIQFTMKLFVSAPFYRSLIYDPFRKYYYRIADHEMPITKEDGTLPLFTEKFWSFIVLDENFNHLGEFKFAIKDYVPLIFPTEKGIFLIKNVDNNKMTYENLHLYKISNN